MDEERKKQLEATVEGIWAMMGTFGAQTEETIPAGEAAEERRALGRRIGRLYLAFARVLIDRLGEEEAKPAILEAIRDYSFQCAEARKAGMMDLPQRGIHEKTEVVEEKGERRLRSWGCGISQEFRRQGRRSWAPYIVMSIPARSCSRCRTSSCITRRWSRWAMTGASSTSRSYRTRR